MWKMTVNTESFSLIPSVSNAYANSKLQPRAASPPVPCFSNAYANSGRPRRPPPVTHVHHLAFSIQRKAPRHCTGEALAVIYQRWRGGRFDHSGASGYATNRQNQSGGRNTGGRRGDCISHRYNLRHWLFHLLKERN